MAATPDRALPAPSAAIRPWVMAARPPTLWAAVAPVLVGTGSAVGAGAFRWDGFLVTMFAALCIQVGVNFANDLADAARGADTEARIGPTRAVAAGLITPKGMRTGMIAAFGTASVAGLYLIRLGGWPILVIGVFSIVAALGYTNGPVPYGYKGLGEVFVFTFFGLVATVGTRFVFDRTAPLEIWIAAIPMGLFAAAILEANNVRDIETDREAGKRTLAVMLGRNGARRLFTATLCLAFAAIALGVFAGWLPRLCLVALAAAPLVVPLITAVRREVSGPALIGVLVGTARLQLVAAILLAAGLAR